MKRGARSLESMSSCLGSALLLAACVAPFSLPELPPTHPASPEAAEAWVPEPSSTLQVGQRPASPAARYACAMHPEVTSPHAGTCARCGMPLQPIGGSDARRARD